MVCIQMNLNNTLTFLGKNVVGRVRLDTYIVEQIVLHAFMKEPAPLNCIVLSQVEFIMVLHQWFNLRDVIRIIPLKFIVVFTVRMLLRMLFRSILLRRYRINFF